MNIDHKVLKGVVDEIEASRARQKGETEFQREALKAAVKNHQLDAKAIRIVLQRRAMGEEKRDEQDYYVHAYEMALGGKKLAADALASGATIREAAAIGRISTGAAGSLAKVVQKSSKMDTPHDADGVVTETQESCGGAGSPSAEDADGPLRVGAVQIGAASSPEVAPGPHDTNADEAPAPRSVGAVGPSSGRVAPTEEITSKCKQASDLRTSEGAERITPFMGDDPGDPPPFLIRAQAGRGAA